MLSLAGQAAKLLRCMCSLSHHRQLLGGKASRMVAILLQYAGIRAGCPSPCGGLTIAISGKRTKALRGNFPIAARLRCRLTLPPQAAVKFGLRYQLHRVTNRAIFYLMPATHGAAFTRASRDANAPQHHRKARRSRAVPPLPVAKQKSPVTVVT